MRNTKSWIRSKNQNTGLLLGGDFGFDITHKRLYAGFGLTNQEIVLKSGDTGWLPIVLQNEWEIYNDVPAFCKNPFEMVSITGKVRNGELNKSIATLPENARPLQNKTFVCVAGVGFIRVDVNTGGQIIPISQTPISFISLEINFRR